MSKVMTNNKPEIVAWFKPASDATLNSVDAVITDRSMKNRPEVATMGFTEPLVRLSDYEALQSQEREDSLRLDWLQQSDGRFFKLLHITSIVGKGFSPTNSNNKWFSSLREAIDHARRIEGGEP